MRKIFVLITILFLLANNSMAYVMPMMGMWVGEGHEGEFHPFLSHVGMPDQPGEIDLRITGFQQRLGGTSENGYGAHLETGLWDRIGLHIRNDDIQKAGTEIMLQFAVLRSEDKEEGFALTIENEMPGTTGEAVVKFKFGLTGTKSLWGHPLHLSFHYDPKNKMTEYAASQIMKVNERLALVLEYSETSNTTKSSYILEALKIAVSPILRLGIGFQSPLSSNKEFDTKTLLQIELNF